MREVTFRGKRLDNGQWAYGSLCQTHGETFIGFPTEPDNPVFFMDWVAVDPKTVGQSICNKDKAGTPIFEGDIVKREWQYKSDPELDEWGRVMYYNYMQTGYTIGAVRFQPSKGFFLTKGYTHYDEPDDGERQDLEFYSLPIKASKCLVVGTIYDNPELLTMPK